VISRSVSVRVTVVSLCTSEMMRLSFAAPSDLIAASLIDHLDRKLCRGDAADADLRHAAGCGIERTDIDGISSVTTERHRAEGPGSQCAARLDEEFAAAVLLGEEGASVRSRDRGRICGVVFSCRFLPVRICRRGLRPNRPPLQRSVTPLEIVYNIVSNIIIQRRGCCACAGRVDGSGQHGRESRSSQ